MIKTKIVIISEMLFYAEGIKKIILEMNPAFEVKIYETADNFYQSDSSTGFSGTVMLITGGPFKKIYKEMMTLKSDKKSMEVSVLCSRKCWIYINRLTHLVKTGFIDYEDKLININTGIYGVLSGKFYMSDSLCELILNERLFNNHLNPFDELTDLEFLIAEELSYHTDVELLARELNINMAYMNGIRRKIFKKLGIKNDMYELQKIAEQYHLIH